MLHGTDVSQILLVLLLLLLLLHCHVDPDSYDQVPRHQHLNHPNDVFYDIVHICVIRNNVVAEVWTITWYVIFLDAE